jgi:hypothetical protein
MNIRRLVGLTKGNRKVMVSEFVGFGVPTFTLCIDDVGIERGYYGEPSMFVPEAYVCQGRVRLSVGRSVEGGHRMVQEDEDGHIILIRCRGSVIVDIVARR